MRRRFEKTGGNKKAAAEMLGLEADHTLGEGAEPRAGRFVQLITHHR